MFGWGVCIKCEEEKSRFQTTSKKTGFKKCTILSKDLIVFLKIAFYITIFQNC